MIQIEGLSKSYNKNEVLKNISLTIHNGSIQALLGANGAGKSTLIYSIADIIEYKAKKIEYNFERTGFVFDKPVYIDKFSAKEYLEFIASMRKMPKTSYGIRIDELLVLLELPTDNKKYIESYSKGMKAKVSLAAALLHNPDNLVLDEPFDGVDFVSTQKICLMLKEMAQKGCAILITSHQFDIIANVCDHFALLKNGDIIFNKAISVLETEAEAYLNSSKDSVKLYIEEIMCNPLY